MFTGIITHTAKITNRKSSAEGLLLSIARPHDWRDLVLGESIATNGVCLTVSSLREDEYDCFLMPETLARTAFGAKVPDVVNLERSLSVSERFGGHFVQGHVDGVGKVTRVVTDGEYRLYVSFGIQNESFVVYKGSIAINGVSLTVAEVANGVLGVALIPHTLEHTTLSDLKVDDEVNLEFDMIGKYVVKNMALRS